MYTILLTVWGANACSRREPSHEHRPTVGRGPAVGQVGGDRVAHVNRQRQSVVSASLATHHELTGPPIEIAQLQARRLSGAQTQPGQHKQDGEVPPSRDRATVRRRDDRLHG